MSLSLLVALPASGQKKKPEFLISIYSPPPADFLTDAQYQVLKEAHVDVIFNIGPGVASDRAGNLKTLDMARQHGLKVYAYDARINQGEEAIRAMVNDYRAHPALAGYYITDEPDSARLQSAIDLQRLVTRLDPTRDAYVNHLPDWAVNNYEQGFLTRWIEGVGKENLNYLAFDNYPYKRKQRLEKTHFNNLDIIRRLGLRYGVKTSSCLQSFGMYFSGVEELRRPNADEMRLNGFSNLAYGVKNPVWFPYWTQIRHSEVLTFSPCIIDSAGVKTDLYEPFKILNGEMKQLGKTLIRLDAREVYHTGDSLWLGTAHPPADFVWKVLDENADVILSRFTDQATDTQEYIMVVNKSFKEAKELSFRVGSSVKRVKEISKATGKPVQVPFDPKTHTLKATFLPGEGRLYSLH
ncbi:hypothetical protein GCM10027275_00560 [Rhabdobacter roseus]|uniref:Glycoside hydrolase family 42 N-terminal domain-containing protein n=2 Tax=Rhabdobacter roseus TaxID=1655419 RepID=A0A840TPG0_9BACT|nr:hypothetical protein [Rhabdobacter roseus]